MIIENILKLLDAGYTKAEIEAMTASAEPSQPAEPVSEPVNEEPAQTPASNEEVVNSLIEEIRGLKKQMQMHSIINDGLNPKQETAQDILASIINPVERK